MTHVLRPFFLALLLAFAACGEADPGAGGAPDTLLAADTAQAPAPAPVPSTAAPADVVALLGDDPRFTTFVAALDTAGLAEPLRGAGPFTIFAPTDAAFDALPAGTLDDLLRPEHRDRLRDVLLYHVVQGVYPAAALRDTTLMAQQAGLLRTRADGGLTVAGAPVVEADRRAGNGVVHVLDTVLTPPEL